MEDFFHGQLRWRPPQSLGASATMNLKKFAADAMRRLNIGHTVIPNEDVQHYAQQQHLKALISLLGIDCVFDVGANEGQYGQFLRRQIGYRGHIVSFEPNPACIPALEKRAKADGRWLVKPYALGRNSGSALLKVMASSTFSSFLSPDHGHVGLFTKKNSVVSEVDVQVRTLDDAAPEILSKLKAVSPYLKMDTQGFDLEVVAGATDSLDRFSALQTEASVVPIYQGAIDYAEAIRRLQALGFELSGIFLNNPQHFPRLIEFDCHMINRRVL